MLLHRARSRTTRSIVDQTITTLSPQLPPTLITTSLKIPKPSPFSQCTRSIRTTPKTPPSTSPTTFSPPFPHQPSFSHQSPHFHQPALPNHGVLTSKRRVSYDPRKWESDYKPSDPLSGLPKDPFRRPLKHSTVQPGMDPGKDTRKREFIQRLRWQLNEGVYMHDALPKTRDAQDPLKPFIPQIPLMEDEPYKLQEPSPIWLAFEKTPKIKDFFAHYLPSREKWQRTKNLMHEYTKGPLDVLHPQYKTFVYKHFSIKRLCLYLILTMTGVSVFEGNLLSKTDLEEMFEITAKNYIRSESFIMTANTVQEMVNLGILDPNISVLEAKIFLEETLNVGYAYNAQVLKDLSYLIEGLSKSIEFRYPDEENPNEVTHIDHFSQTDVDISYIELERYLASLERFFEIFYTKDIEMVDLATHTSYPSKIASPRQEFWARVKKIWVTGLYGPFCNIYNGFLKTFDLMPVDSLQNASFTNPRLDIGFNPSGSSTTKPHPQLIDQYTASNAFTTNSMAISTQPFNVDPYSYSKVPGTVTHKAPTGDNSIDQRIWDAELHNIDFSQTATLQFNPHVAKLVDFYFDELPTTFSYRHHIYNELINPHFELNQREEAVQAALKAVVEYEDRTQVQKDLDKRLFQHKFLKYGVKTNYAETFFNDKSPFANPLLSKDPNVSFMSDYKHRFLTESFLPTHLQAFKSAYMQSRSIRDVDQLLQESKMMSLRKNDPNSVENSPLAALYCQHIDLLEKQTNPNIDLQNSVNSAGIDESYTQWATTVLYNSFWGSMKYLTKTASYTGVKTKEIVDNMYRSTMDVLLPSAVNTLLTDPNILALREYEEELKRNQVEFQQQLDELHKGDSKLKQVKGDGTQLLKSIAPFSNAPLSPVSQKERQAVMEKARKSFDAQGFGVCFADLGRQDYINMLMRHIDMLQNIRLLLSKLAQRVYMNIDDFNPLLDEHLDNANFASSKVVAKPDENPKIDERGGITGILRKKEYLLAYYNQAALDLIPKVRDNNDFPLLPTLYQYNDIPNKAIRVLKERLAASQQLLSDKNYRESILNDVLKLKKELQVDDGLSLKVIENGLGDEMMLKFFIHEPISGKLRPVYTLDRIPNRFEDDPEKTSDMQQSIGRVVTKLDMCLFQALFELERQRSIFQLDIPELSQLSKLPAAIHVNTNLLTHDDRFVFDLQYQQEDYVRQLQLQEMSRQFAGKTLDYSHLQQEEIDQINMAAHSNVPLPPKM